MTDGSVYLHDSNTKTALFRQYAHAFQPFQEIVASTPKPHAVDTIDALDQDRGCRLGSAADMLTMLSGGLRKLPNVEAVAGNVARADFRPSHASWSTVLDSTSRPAGQNFSARNLIMCVGSSPTTMTLPYSSPTMLDLDDVLDRPTLRRQLSMTDERLVVGVVGTSHSAIVAIMNLFELATTTNPRLRIHWFVRSPLSYAIHMDGWILRDNTGLKGMSADFARENLEDDKLVISPVGKILTKVQCWDIRDRSMKPHVSACTHLVPAIGYTRDPVPRLAINGTEVDGISYDPVDGNLLDHKGDNIPHAFGAGIAFPERVTDPAGNTEHAVGLWKFIKYLTRVAPSWC